MDNHRRQSDHNFIRQFWAWATPWGHIIGFLILCGFVVGTNYNRFEAQAKEVDSIKLEVSAHGQRLNQLEVSNSRIDQKLDDIIFYFNIPHRK